jgi:molecular chaperone DnaJ
MSKDYYKILGVEKNATTEEVKKAFKKAAMQYHPDRPGGDEKKFKEINEAYQVLGDADKRTKYDQFGSDFEQQGGWGSSGASWEDVMSAFRNQQGRGGGFSFDFGGNAGDVFSDLFGFGDLFGGGGGRKKRKSSGRDIQIDAELDFKEAAFGVEKNISLRKQSACDVCGGSGNEPGGKMEKCSTCGGQGQVVQQQRTFLGMMQTVAECSSCNGRGERPSKRCKHCGGDGVLSKTQDIRIKIPAGIDEGESIRLSGYGETAPHGGGSGDLYVRVHIRQNKYFHREGFDVFSDLEISFAQAVFGGIIEVETIDGKVNLSIPEGVEHGQLVKIKGQGITHLGKNQRGDHYVKIKIRIPKKLSRDARKKLEELKNDL